MLDICKPIEKLFQLILRDFYLALIIQVSLFYQIALPNRFNKDMLISHRI